MPNKRCNQFVDKLYYCPRAKDGKLDCAKKEYGESFAHKSAARYFLPHPRRRFQPQKSGLKNFQTAARQADGKINNHRFYVTQIFCLT